MLKKFEEMKVSNDKGFDNAVNKLSQVSNISQTDIKNNEYTIKGAMKLNTEMLENAVVENNKRLLDKLALMNDHMNKFENDSIPNLKS
jgi:hypothetical protein